MRKSRAFRRIVILILLAMVIAAQTAIFWYFWDTYYSEGMDREFFFKGDVAFVKNREDLR